VAADEPITGEVGHRPRRIPPMNVADIMTRAVVTVDMDDTLERIRDIFDHSRFHHLVVIDDGRVVGVLSDRDLLKHLSPFVGNIVMERPQDVNTLRKKAHQIMRRRPIVARPELPVPEATQLFINEGITCLPVVGADQRLRGIVTLRDILPHCFNCRRPHADAA
jgi:acetoin utilization protein AcuB